ncbi:MAG: serine/threonine protein kinase [Polyangiaceae bacterium]|nr:serine/threonine protein kinase [Polyangiaceae bacterium]
MSDLDDRIGSLQLGAFRILRRLGEGSFATAFLAEQMGTERLAVVKIARAEKLPSGASVRDAFAREVRAATRVSHPNLVSIYFAGETTDGLPAYAMEYVPGFTFDARMTRCSFLPLREMEAYFAQIARALRSLHAAGIVHRDVSPNNVMVTVDEEGQPKATLLDLGIALLHGYTDADAIAGTPGYTAPEQLRGEAAPASDMFALGALLFYAVTGAALFNDEDDVSAVMTKTSELSRSPDPRERRPALPAAMASLVMSLLDPRPTNRPTASAFIERWPTAMRAMFDAAATVTVPIPREIVLRQPRVPTLLAIRVDPSTKQLVSKRASLAGWNVDFADDARAATRAQEGRYDAFLLPADLQQPSTRAVARHLREFHPSCPIILAFYSQDQEMESLDFRPHLIVRLPQNANGLWFFLRALTPEDDEEEFEPVVMRG